VRHPVNAQARYVPAAGWRLFTKLYDPVLRVTMRERRFRGLMLGLAAADLPPGGTLLDVGCGTGTFTLAVAGARPDTRVLGADGDQEILDLAGDKEGADGIEWHRALAGALPLPDRSVDVVTMSLMLHHLLPADKHAALVEARRVLRPAGRLHVADWGRPRDPLMRVLFGVLRRVDGLAQTRDHAAGRLPGIIEDAGFRSVQEHARMRTSFGSLEILSATSNVRALGDSHG